MKKNSNYANSSIHCIASAAIAIRPLLFLPKQPRLINLVEKNDILRVLFSPRATVTSLVAQTVCSGSNHDQPEKVGGCSATSGNNNLVKQTKSLDLYMGAAIYMLLRKLINQIYPLFHVRYDFCDLEIAFLNSRTWLNNKISWNYGYMSWNSHTHSVPSLLTFHTQTA